MTSGKCGSGIGGPSGCLETREARTSSLTGATESDEVAIRCSCKYGVRCSCKLRFAIYISYVCQNFDLRMLSFTRIARGNFRTLPVFYL